MGTGHSRLTSDSIQAISEKTKFDKSEVQAWYPTFVKEVGHNRQPVMTREHLYRLFKSFFPFGDSTRFADLVYLLFTRNSSSSSSNTGTSQAEEGISYGDFLVGLSVASRGGTEEKIKWTFRFYDVDGEGRISRDDLLTVMQAAFEMAVGMVELQEGEGEEETAEARVDRIFDQLPAPHKDSSHIDYDLFQRLYHDNPDLLQGLIILDSLV
jgi:Ca2+-binding EF-hand superfamily protein